MTDGAVSDDGADVATFGRSDFDDAPRDIKKRWLVVSAGLAAAAVGAAIVIGPALRGDDLGLTPANPAPSETVLSQDKQDAFEGDCFRLAMDAENYGADRRELVSSTLTFDPMELATHHVTGEYQFVVIRNGLVQTTCVGDGDEQLSARFTEASGEDPEVFLLYSRETLTDSGEILEVGELDDQVVSMTVTTPDGEVEAKVDGGFYSVVQANDYEEVDRTYEATYENAGTRTITSPDRAAGQGSDHLYPAVAGRGAPCKGSTMTDASPNPSPLIVVTGANGLVGSRVCRELSERGARVRAVVRRAGTAPDAPGVEEEVGDFTNIDFAAVIVLGADSVVSTVHPMGSDRETQQRVGVEGTTTLVEAARDAGVSRFVHISTAAVYDRSPGRGDVDESSALVDDDSDDYSVTKRDTDAAIAAIDGMTRVLIRPPAILGVGATSMWNTLRPATMRDEEWARHAIQDKSFGWVHVDDLATLTADVAMDRTVGSDDAAVGPLEGACTAVNVSGGPATTGDYVEAVLGALDLEPIWEEGEAWRGQILADRAHAWGWTPHVDLTTALDEISRDLTASE